MIGHLTHKRAKFNTCKMIIIPKSRKNVPVNNSHLKVVCKNTHMTKATATHNTKVFSATVFHGQFIRESVDSLCRDGADTPIVRVHRKAFLTREQRTLAF